MQQDQRDEAVKHSKFVSSQVETETHQLTHMENYSEIDWFELEMKMRKLVHQMIEPCIKQAVEDRAQTYKLNRCMEDHEKRVNDIEIILFQKDEEDRKGLFDSIYQKINENEKLRLMEEQRIRSEISTMTNDIKNLIFSQSNINKINEGLESQQNLLKNEFKDFNERLRGWQEEFLKQYTSQQDQMIKDVSEIRNQNMAADNSLFKKEQEIRKLQVQVQKLETLTDDHDSWLHKVQSTIENLLLNKQEAKEFEQIRKDIEANIDKIKIDVENHGNHFAMVENFVEKYIPIRIQSTISEVLSFILPYKEKNKLSEFEKKRFGELHQIILEDDGIPHLIDQLKQIRMNIDQNPMYNKKFLRKLNRGLTNRTNRNQKKSKKAVEEEQDSQMSESLTDEEEDEEEMEEEEEIGEDLNQPEKELTEKKSEQSDSKSKRTPNAKKSESSQINKSLLEGQKNNSSLEENSSTLDKNLKNPDRRKSSFFNLGQEKSSFKERRSMFQQQNPISVQKLQKQVTIQEQKNSVYDNKDSKLIEANNQLGTGEFFDQQRFRSISEQNLPRQVPFQKLDLVQKNTIQEEDSNGYHSSKDNNTRIKTKHKKSKQTPRRDQGQVMMNNVQNFYFDAQDDLDELFENQELLNKKMQHLLMLPQKTKLMIDDIKVEQNKKFEQFEQKLNLQLKEQNEHIQTLHSELQEYLGIKKKEKNSYLLELTVAGQKIEDLYKQKTQIQKSLQTICTIIACNIENINLETQYKYQRYLNELQQQQSKMQQTNENSYFSTKDYFNNNNINNNSSQRNFDSESVTPNRTLILNKINNVRSHSTLKSQEKGQNHTQSFATTQNPYYDSFNEYLKNSNKIGRLIKLDNAKYEEQQQQMQLDSSRSGDSISQQQRELKMPQISSIQRLNNRDKVNSWRTAGGGEQKQFTEERNLNFQIAYRDHLLDRNIIFSIHQIILKKCQDLMNQSQLFTQNNLTCQRVFKDCTTFINLSVPQKQQQLKTGLQKAMSLEQIEEVITQSKYQNQDSLLEEGSETGAAMILQQNQNEESISQIINPSLNLQLFANSQQQEADYRSRSKNQTLKKNSILQVIKGEKKEINQITRNLKMPKLNISRNTQSQFVTKNLTDSNSTFEPDQKMFKP